MKSEDKKNEKFTIEWFAKLIGLIAIVAGIFGVSFQKGMIMSMNLGNLSGNYEIREVFNSAILGFFFALSRFTDMDFWQLLPKTLWIAIVFLVLGLLACYLFKNEKAVKEKLNRIDFSPTSIRYRILKSYWFSSIAGGVFGIIITFIGAAAWYLVFTAIAVLLLPSVMGYLLGAAYIDRKMDNPPCRVLTEKMMEQKLIRQCTQVTIKGKKIMGEIVLENKDAYFIQQNSSFLYITKNGNNCVYSIHSKTKDIENREKFSFDDSSIKQLCLGSDNKNELSPEE
ncbi:hypothetical protein MKZ42_09050 [Pseudoalteromonas shioyasakiensis]|jgi:hypothetical protein|uniref:Uncharacterized protein n=1 Tax=Pseudoalteromonas shioyasakiensis TaxID=1190813 RepID=A0ABT6U0N4_9GAMM|nr:MULTISPECIES: hypothetical protein [Pseudoalteromonas]MDI4669402.1 hypothetical protein [Pseudoalteromonas shioyasakiensis]MDI4673405.1 hypothetical protein [Pseudoalteromonas shioyasakiensis]MDI4685902.1 hypothetical protein [Pseudoalteromonas shioyasakiensis]MDI4704192.1 hypothetical protein [Pseudoalteromonas shioyasakiensis]NUJ23499.1 hypothetical protein [Pseudoalteromonas sp. 0802]